MPFQAALILSGYFGVTNLFLQGLLLVVAGTIDAMIIGSILAPDQSKAIGQTTLVIKSASEPHKIVYGRTMGGGTLVLLDVLDDYRLTVPYAAERLIETREPGKVLHMAFAMAAHEISEVEQVYIGDELVYDLSPAGLRMINAKYKGLIELEVKRGEPNQVSSEYILAQLNHHYYGNTLADSQYPIYYSAWGVSAVSGNQITINTNARNTETHPNPLAWTTYADDNGNGEATGLFIGTYAFTKAQAPAKTIPVGGIPWSASHKLTNTAYLYLRFRYDSDVYDSGIPKVRAVIKGKKVYDPRRSVEQLGFTPVDRGSWTTGATYNFHDMVTLPDGTNRKYWLNIPSYTAEAFSTEVFKNRFIDNANWEPIHEPLNSYSWEWSDNWALCLRDYLTSGNYYSRTSATDNNLYGVGVAAAEIDDLNVSDTANIADEIVYYDTGHTIVSEAWEAPYLTFNLGNDVTNIFVAGENVELAGMSEFLEEAIRTGTIAIRPTAELGIEAFYIKSRATIHSTEYLPNSYQTAIKVKLPRQISTVVGTTVRVYARKFTVNGVIDTGNSPLSNVEHLLACGAAVLPYVQGIYKFQPGVYVDPNIDNITITDDFLAGALNISGSLGAQNVINTVTGTYSSIADLGEETDFYKQSSPVYIAEDGGYELTQSVTYPLVTSNFTAQRLARLSLQRARKQVSATLLCNLKALNLSVGSTVKLTIPRVGWVDKVFSIVSWSLQDSQISIGIREEDPLAYSWVSADLVPLPFKPATEFDHRPDLTNISNLVATSGTASLKQLADGTIVPQVLLTWTPPAVSDEFSSLNTQLELQVTNVTDPNESKTMLVRDIYQGSLYLTNVKEDDLLQIRGRIIPTASNSSIDEVDYTDIVFHIVVGKSQPPADVSNFTSVISEDMLVFSWDINTEIDFSHYEIRKGPSWESEIRVDVTDSTEYILTGGTTGTETYYVKAIDTSGNPSTNAASTVVTISAPSPISGITVTPLDSSINISWPETVAGSFSLAGYIIKHGAEWGTGIPVTTTKSTEYNIIAPWLGSRQYMIRAVDIYGNKSAEVSTTIVKTAPSAPIISPHSFITDRVEFTWTGVPGTFPINSYEIRYDDGSGIFDDATPLMITRTDAFSRKVDWGGTRRFWVMPIDTIGNQGTPSTETIVVQPPNTPSVPTPQVIDNNVLLRWNDSANTLPILHYEVRKGATYGSSTLIGNIAGLFSAIFEVESGQYTYWITAIDTAGTPGVSASVLAEVAEPPDYLLRANVTDDFTIIDTSWISRNLVNAQVRSDGALLLPVDTSETWSTHYTGNSWTTPQNQIDALFPIYAQPTPASGTYEVIFDYEQVLTNMSVTLELQTEVVAGDGVLSSTIAVSDNNITYTPFPINQTRVYTTSVRYVKVTLEVSSSPADTDIIKVTQLGIRLDIKEKSDAGSGTALASDVGGTTVNFNKAFVDISSIVVTPQISDTPNDPKDIIAVYDFVDSPSPTTFSVYLFRASTGARVDGPFSWAVRGS